MTAAVVAMTAVVAMLWLALAVLPRDDDDRAAGRWPPLCTCSLLRLPPEP